MDINKTLAQELAVQLWQIEAAVKLIDEGNTIPFISRYRKEATGSLNDEVLRKLYERLTYLRNLEEKKNSVISSIEEQGKMTEELRPRFWQQRLWWWWTTFTARTGRNAVPVQPLQKSAA